MGAVRPPLPLAVSAPTFACAERSGANPPRAVAPIAQGLASWEEASSEEADALGSDEAVMANGARLFFPLKTETSA